MLSVMSCRLLCCLALGLLSTVAKAEGFVDLPVPEGARVSSLGDQMRINGVRARLKEVSYAGKPEELLQFYRDKFEAGGLNGPAREGGGISAVVGLVDDNMVTVRIAGVAGGRVTAQVMQSLPEELSPAALREAQAAAQAEMPPQSQRVSDIESYDRGARSKLIIYINEHSVDTNIDFVRERLAESKFAQGDRHLDPQTRTTTVWYGAGAGSDARLSVRDAGGRRTVTLNVVRTLSVQGDVR
jgi:hypothetical protein